MENSDNNYEHDVFSCLFQHHEDINVIRSFPGNLPVSLDRGSLHNVIPFGYVCSLKADGERCFLFLVSFWVDGKRYRQAYTYDRSERVRFLNDRLGFGENDNDDDDPDVQELSLSILDVEVVGDLLLCFDLLCAENHVYVEECYLKRHGALEGLLRRWVDPSAAPYYDDGSGSSVSAWRDIATEQLTTSRDDVPVVHFPAGQTLVVKPIFDLVKAGSMWETYRKKGAATMEGIIFTRLRNRYEPFRCSGMSVVKWKHLAVVSVDFSVFPVREKDAVVGCEGVPEEYTTGTTGNVSLGCRHVSGRQDDVVVCRGYVGPEVHDVLVSGTICEFVYDTGRWTCIKVRRDKTFANTVETFRRTVESLVENITIDEISRVLDPTTTSSSPPPPRPPAAEGKHIQLSH